MNIAVDGVTKRFGAVQALDDVSFSVAPGECFCLVGRNGAGKSTLIQIMAGMLPPDRGDVRYDDESIGTSPVSIKRRIGVLPDREPTIPELTGAEYLDLVSMLHRLPPWKERAAAAERVARLMGSGDALHRRTATYSRGMRARLGICAALLHDAPCVLLDEPFSSLDPVSAADLVALLLELRAEGRSLLVSSHNLAQTEQIATHIGVIDAGRMAFTGALAHFAERGAGSLERSLLALLRQPGEPGTGPDTSRPDVE